VAPCLRVKEIGNAFNQDERRQSPSQELQLAPQLARPDPKDQNSDEQATANNREEMEFLIWHNHPPGHHAILPGWTGRRNGSAERTIWPPPDWRLE